MDRVASQYMERVNHFVPNLTYHSNVDQNGQAKIDIAAMAALDADGILAAQSIASAGSTTTFASTYSRTAMGQYGRAVSVVASGAATSTVTVIGRDYLGQMIKETLTLNGTTTVNGNKAFASIEQVSWGATASVTINLGWGNKLGLPFRCIYLDTELVSGAVPANAGALTAGASASTAQTATSNDPRGLYTPHASNVPDGTITHTLVMQVDRASMFGIAHYYA